MEFDEKHLGEYTLALLRHTRIVGAVLVADVALDEIRNNCELTEDESLYLKYALIIEAYEDGWDK